MNLKDKLDYLIWVVESEAAVGKMLGLTKQHMYALRKVKVIKDNSFAGLMIIKGWKKLGLNITIDEYEGEVVYQKRVKNSKNFHQIAAEISKQGIPDYLA